MPTTLPIKRWPRLDVVVPLWNEEENLPPLHQRLVDSLSTLSCTWNILYVDDGSRDQTAAMAAELAARDIRIHCLRLSRNFGQPAAIAAGLDRSTGDCLVVMDGDQQDPPELIPQMFDRWQAGFEVIIAHRPRRSERGLRGLAMRGFHRVFRYLSDLDIPPDTGTFCLLDRRAVEAIRSMPESHRFFPGLRARAGFRQLLVSYERPDRTLGSPKQSFRRLLRYAADAVFSYSFKPLRLVTSLGALICLASMTLAMVFAAKRLLGWEDASTGFTTLTCAVLGLGGCQLIALGILGEYVGRIYEEVKRRPAYFPAEDEPTNRTAGIDSQRRAG